MDLAVQLDPHHIHPLPAVGGTCIIMEVRTGGKRAVWQIDWNTLLVYRFVQKIDIHIIAINFVHVRKLFLST